MALAALAALACLLAVWNAHVASSFNDSTATLASNMTAAQEQDADLDALASSQRQVDAQFTDLTGSSALQWPALRDAVRANADASAALSADLARRIAERDAQAGATGDGGTSQDQPGQGQSTQGDDAADKKLENLLANNGQQDSPAQSQQDPTDSGDGGTQNPDVKPW